MGCQWEDIPRPVHKGNQGIFWNFLDTCIILGEAYPFIM